MSAAAARRRKQLAARQVEQDTVATQLNKLLSDNTSDGTASSNVMDEATAYEALQLAQSVVRKKIHSGAFAEGCDLAYQSALTLLRKGRVSVASQLLSLLADALRETHTEVTDLWLDRLLELDQAHLQAMQQQQSTMAKQEAARLHRLQGDWLNTVLQWTNDLGTIRLGHPRIHQALGQQYWLLSKLPPLEEEGAAAAAAAAGGGMDDDDEEEVMDMQCDAVAHMALAEQPQVILEWLQTLPGPTAEQTKAGHECPPAARDALLTRAVLLWCAVENLRDANVLVRAYLEKCETREAKVLTKSYTAKEDGQAPSHVIFCCMLLRICEMDMRTGPLFSWLLRSFKRELDKLHKPQVIVSYTTKIGKIYFNIQPPPNMLSMMENMLNMTGGGGGGMNPAMMQAALAQMQAGGLM